MAVLNPRSTPCLLESETTAGHNLILLYGNNQAQPY